MNMLKRRISRDVMALTSFTQDIVAAGYVPGAHVVRFCFTNAEDISAKLQSRSVVELTRARTADGVVICVEDTFLPGKFYPLLRDADKTKSLYELLAKAGGHVHRAEEQLIVRPPTIEEANLLRINPHSHIICIQRLAFDEAGNPVEYTMNALHPDNYEFNFTVETKQHARQIVPVAI